MGRSMLKNKDGFRVCIKAQFENWLVVALVRLVKYVRVLRIFSSGVTSKPYSMIKQSTHISSSPQIMTYKSNVCVPLTAENNIFRRIKLEKEHEMYQSMSVAYLTWPASAFAITSNIEENTRTFILFCSSPERPRNNSRTLFLAFSQAS